MVLVLLMRYSSWRTSWSWRRSSLTSTSIWLWTVQILRQMHWALSTLLASLLRGGDTYLKQHDAPEDIEYYLCGPPMMSKTVLDLLHSLGVEDDMIMFDNFGG